MLDLLSGPILEGTAKAARLNVALGGKTGTSQEYRDAWFVGFTPDLVVGVWVGNDDNSPMNAVTGGSVPTTIWRDFVSGAQKLRPVRPETVSMAPATEPPTRAPGLAPEINGAPVVTGKLKMLRDGSFELGGQIIQLDGVDALDRRLARHVRKLIRHREANCSLAGADGAYRCRVGTLDLNAFILLSRNGAAAADAEPGLQPPDDDIQPVAPRRHSGRHRFWFFHW
jgi:membrane peptidoglycan carboxypeptidase